MILCGQMSCHILSQLLLLMVSILTVSGVCTPRRLPLVTVTVASVIITVVVAGGDSMASWASRVPCRSGPGGISDFNSTRTFQ